MNTTIQKIIRHTISVVFIDNNYIMLCKIMVLFLENTN